MKTSTEGKSIILILYVDNIILTNDDVEEMGKMKKNLSFEFKIKDLGQLRYFHRMEIAKSNKRIIMSQQNYIQDLLK